MAKVQLNPVMEGIRGSIGDLVFKHYGEEVIVGRKPDRGGQPPTTGQQQVRNQFKLATVYGKAVLADPVAKALYEPVAQGKGIHVFALTIADFFHAPVVDEIDLSAYTGQPGGTIRIRASDDFQVTSVEVAIRMPDGTALEQGLAAAVAGDGTWTYQATTALPAGQTVSIEVSALDRPGHKGTRTETRGA